ncbi:retrovirus-related pol polyprotein from transposon TNT 1-94 [Tanacetum coccineum]
MTQVKVLMALADDELAVRKNHACNVPKSEAVNECLKLTKAPTNPESSIESGSEPLTTLPLLKNLHEASPSSKVMPLTYQDHSPRERPGLGTMKHTKPETQESSSKSVSGPVTISDTKPVTSLVPTEVKNTEQDSKIDELTKLVQMLLDEKINSSQKTQEPKTKSSNSASSSKISQDVKHKDHKTSDHEMYVALLKKSENDKAQPYQYASPTKQILKDKAKPFPPCTNYGFNDHGLDDCRNYPECEICGKTHQGTIWYMDSGYSRSMTGVKSYMHKYVEQPGPKVVFGDNSSCITEGYFHAFGYPVFIHNHKEHLGKFDVKVDDGYFLGYSFISKALRVFNTRRQQIKETYHVTFNESIEAIRFTNTFLDEIGIDDSSRYPSDEFLHEGPPDQVNTEESQRQAVQDEPINNQPTEEPPGINTETYT